jgi:transcriptional regulator with XRE-family HTH domain
MTKGRMTNRTQQIDWHVGSRIRERRTMLGFTQQQLADLIGVTYQQAHKYERGINRVSAGRLYELAQVLGVPVAFFYDGLDTPVVAPVNDRQRLCLELARNFSLITNARHQEALTQLARALASHEVQESLTDEARHAETEEDPLSAMDDFRKEIVFVD